VSSREKKKRERRAERKVKFRKGLAIDLRIRQYKRKRGNLECYAVVDKNIYIYIYIES
jgi:hypothetical protein